MSISSRVARCRLVVALFFAAAVGFPASAASEIDKSSGDGYEIWDVSGMKVYDLSDGETLSNILVDQRGDGATLTIRSRNKTNWRVENIGFRGVGTNGDGSNSFQLQVSAPDGGSGVVENVWMNNKTRNGEEATSLGGIYIRSSHGGHIDIRHTYIEGFGNNAVYGSAVGKDGGAEGSITIENCYHRDNTVSQFRIGSPDSVVRNCVAVVNDPDGLRATYPGKDDRNARGIWGKHFRNQRVVNSSFYISSEDVAADSAFEARYIEDRSRGPEAVLEVVDCELNEDAPRIKQTTANATVNITNLGNQPTVDVIQDGGVPTSAKMAARGNREMPPELPGADGGDDPLPHTLQIDGSGSDRTDYSFTVSGELEGYDALGEIGEDDVITGSSAEGFVRGGSDGYRYSGRITAFEMEGDATVYVDDEEWNPADCCGGDTGVDAGDTTDTGRDASVPDSTDAATDDTGGSDDGESRDTKTEPSEGEAADASDSDEEGGGVEPESGCRTTSSETPGPGLFAMLLFLAASLLWRRRDRLD